MVKFENFVKESGTIDDRLFLSSRITERKRSSEIESMEPDRPQSRKLKYLKLGKDEDIV